MACVTDTPGEYRLYQDLAPWWPLISPPGEYVADAAVLGRVFAAAPSAVRTVLDLGSGGGHVAWHLTGRLELTLVDRSEEMLAVSRELNPDCEHVQCTGRSIVLFSVGFSEVSTRWHTFAGLPFSVR